jgi:threonine/homoserine/homoserine lactone efflux protein
MLRAGVSPAVLFNPAAEASRWEFFATTYLVTALKPKGIVFFVAFLPQFVSPGANAAHRSPALDPGRYVCGATIVNATLYAVFAASARKLMSSPGASRRFNLAGGTLLSAAGIWALMAKR